MYTDKLADRQEGRQAGRQACEKAGLQAPRQVGSLASWRALVAEHTHVELSQLGTPKKMDAGHGCTHRL